VNPPTGSPFDLDGDRWRRLMSLLNEALDLEAKDVASYLARSCPDDSELRDEVMSLLDADAKAGSFMAAPVGVLPLRPRIKNSSHDAPLSASSRTSDPAPPPAPTPPAPELPPPTRVGRYEIQGEIGRGGMGIVFLGVDDGLGRRVAIKTLPPVFARDPARLARLVREARIVAMLQHPNIASFHGVERTDDGRRFVLLEYIEGRTLADRLRDGALPVVDALDVSAQVADALNVAHARGIIHRDLKPTNVMVTRDGLVKVLDFGLAKHVVQRGTEPAATHAPPAGTSVTVSGVQVGTLGYMSPEQILTPSHDRRTDVFSFGCVLYECLTGEKAFSGETVYALVSATLAAAVDWGRLPAETPSRIRALLARALEKDAQQRLPDLREFAAVLAEAAGPRPVENRERIERPSLIDVTGTTPGAVRSTALLAPFVGRASEIRECRRLLERSRLVTLTGAAGCGKTRLALEVARAFETEPDAVAWFVDLAPVSDPGAVPAAVAEDAGLGASTAATLATEMSRALAGKRGLVVLDNCERLIAACSSLTMALLEQCPELRILTTSREWLGATGEQVLNLPPLATPQAETRDVAAIARTDAVRLFIERARAVRPELRESDDTLRAVGELCRRLDGMPLAIELAAARLNEQDLDAILASLGDRLAPPGGADRGSDALHATLRWSYEQLAPEECRFFRALSVFAGGWTLESATAICGDGRDDFAVLDASTRLVDKSLVTLDLTDDLEPRYRLLEPLRDFAAAMAEIEGETSPLRRRHLNYFIDLAERTAPALLGGPDQSIALAHVAADHQNLLAALRACERVGGGASLALRIAGSMWRFWYVRGYLSLGRGYFASALAMPGAERPTPERALALFAAGGLAIPQEDFVAADALNGAARDLYRTLGDRLGEARALAHLGWTAFEQGRFDDARASYQEAASVFRELGDERRLATMLNNLGNVARNEGNDAAALASYEEAMVLTRRVGDRPVLANVLVNLGLVMVRHGRLPAARRRVVEALELIADLRARRAGVAGLELAAEMLSLLGRDTESARAVGASDAARRAMNLPPDETWRRLVADVTARLRARLDPAAFDAAWGRGVAQPFEECVEATKSALESAALPDTKHAVSALSSWGTAGEGTPATADPGRPVAERDFAVDDKAPRTGRRAPGEGRP
jgi:non-specific serine/threonine protein kinase